MYVNQSLSIISHNSWVTYSVRVNPAPTTSNNQLRFFQFTRFLKCKVVVKNATEMTCHIFQVTISPVSIISSMDHHHHLSDHEHHPHYHHVHDSSHEGSSSGEFKISKNQVANSKTSSLNPLFRCHCNGT